MPETPRKRKESWRARAGGLVLLVVSWFAASAVAPTDTSAFHVVVHSSNRVVSLPKPQVSKIFLKKVQTWEGGKTIVPVDQDASSPVREKFSQAIHGKSAGAVASYWQQQIFAGRDVPPLEKASDEDVLAFVRANPGAIGYVAAGAALADVRIVRVDP